MFDHFSVLQTETINSLQIKANGTYVDCTLGGAGHSAEIAKRLNEEGRLFGFDQDQDALLAAQERLAEYGDTVQFIYSNFSHLKDELQIRDVYKVDGLLFDLGVSSPQLDRDERGFSYHKDAQLDMRMDQNQSLSAYQIVNEWSYQDLVKIFFKYGEEKFSKQIARKIEQARQDKKINTTQELVELIKEGIPAPARRTGGHPAKRIFQALRIAVNDELNVFNDALHQAAEMVEIGGRIAVITFHSLEDRICKKAFRKWSTNKPVPRNLPVLPEGTEAPFKLINRKAIVANEDELSENRRSRSAKLRIIEKVHEWDDSFSYVEGWEK